MRRILLAFALFASPATAKDAPSPPASDTEKENARLDYQKCLLVSSHQMDDDISSADQIAKAIAPMCEAQLHKVAETATRGMKRSWRVYEYMMDDMRKDLTIPTQMVLLARKDRK